MSEEFIQPNKEIIDAVNKAAKSSSGLRNKINGTKLELRVMKFLSEKDYFVIRSSGSHSPIDIIAIPTMDRLRRSPLEDKIKLIQVTSGNKSKNELQSLTNFSRNMSSIISVEVWTIKKGKSISSVKVSYPPFY